MKKRRTLLAALIVVLLLALSSCGDDSSQDYFYSVDVVNNTDASITVRYDREEIYLVWEWLESDTIQVGNRRIIEWSSSNAYGEQIEAEYLGKTKLYTVTQLGTVTVNIQDFQ